MNKYLAWIWILVCSVVLAGCGPEDDGSNSASASTDSTVTLRWTAPVARVNKLPLPTNEIAGYKIYIGATAQEFQLLATISDPSINQYDISNLGPGIYYFAISTYDSENVEGPLSEALVKSI